MAERVRVLVYPRDANPYQELLYEPMRRLGDRVRYVGELSGSRTLNLLLLPLELAVLRLRGYRIFHLHWTFAFTFAGLAGVRGAPRLARGWFELVLLVLRLLGYRLVWTAHNVLPHDPVFDDDLAGRRALVAASSLVIAHTPATLEALTEIGAAPRSARVIPHGPIAPAGVDAVDPVVAHAPRTVAFVGRILRYKGVEDLLDALNGLDRDLRCHIAGACGDPELADDLRVAAARLGDAVRLELGHVPDPELVALLRDCDAVVYPFRSITTSGSLMLALAAGRPVIIPRLAALADVPEEAAFFYAPGIAGLREALREVAGASAQTLRQRGEAARAFSAARSWPSIALATHAALLAAG